MRKKERPTLFVAARITEELFLDNRLSWAAKGIAAYVAAKGPQTVSQLSELSEVDTKYSIKQAIQELIDNDYMALKKRN